ncbi:hypothetical protein HKX48_007781 [Thoreauomyces humboldtii]|nr:hypothetical protein HKX48_007781 [Thoreauomyces humboldtii]
MAEVYSNRHVQMKFHSDQALDLASDSHICLVSFYEDANEMNPRRLVVKNKQTGETDELSMTHNSAILFSTVTNGAYLHKIVAGRGGPPTSDWMGLTFRCSKTFLVPLGEKRLLYPSGLPLRLADDSERRLFFRMKSLENAQVAAHGGGVAFSQLGKDSTDAFHVFHPVETREMLASFYVDDLAADQIRKDPTGVDGGFADDVVRLRAEIESKGWYASSKVWCARCIAQTLAICATAVFNMARFPDSIVGVLASAFLVALFWQQCGTRGFSRGCLSDRWSELYLIISRLART